MTNLEYGVQLPYLQVQNELIDDVEYFDKFEKWVWVVLARHAFGGLSYPSQKTIAEKVGISDRKVRDCLSSLQKKGWIKKVGVNEETQTIKWIVIIPEQIEIDWLEKEIERKRRKGQAVADQQPQDPKKTELKKEIIPYKEIIDYLNERATKLFKSSSKATQEKIRARWNEGHRVEEFKKVINNMVANWKGDEKMDQYLRPETLFGSKFESYLNTKPKSKGPGPRPPQQSIVDGPAMNEEQRKELLAEIGLV